ncbi:MAG: hypothetical protein EOO77_05350 [Oxalobacteraceae bacterium]|nr:MAG: hypothetical protein EOO77_05350 [Oxalobacteraceae bacterium]
MAYIIDGRSAQLGHAIEAKTKAIRVVDCPRGTGYALSGTSGSVAAAAAAGGCFFAMRINPSSTNILTFVERVRLQFTTITAFTTSITAGRRLSLYRGTGAATTGGTQMQPVNVDTSGAVSQVNTATGGDSRIASTATLGVTGITWEAYPIREMALVHLGAAGYQGNDENVFDFSASAPIILQAGQVLGIRNPQAMDAGGVWQISVDIAFHESVAWSSQNLD